MQITMVDRPLTDFGERLRRARESRGISLRQVANVTRITVRALEAVERNDLSRLPGGIFTRAFVRAYAAEVGLDPELTLREFLAQCPGEGAVIPTSAPDTIDGMGAGSWRERVSIRHLALLILLLALAGATIYAFVRWNGTRQPRAEPAVRSRERAVGSREAAVRLPVAPAVVQASNPAAAAVAPLTIEAVARGPCWVSAQADDGSRVERMLASGDRFAVTAARALVLKTGDAGALALRINGQQARPLGTSGQVVTLRIATDNVGTFLAP